jgi:hypothetical protein
MFFLKLTILLIYTTPIFALFHQSLYPNGLSNIVCIDILCFVSSTVNHV